MREVRYLIGFSIILCPLFCLMNEQATT